MKPSDRRFIQYWKDQRTGSKTSYYIVYSVGWAVVAFFVLFFLSKLFTNLWETGGRSLVYIFIAISIITAVLVTHFTYKGNEKRLKKLLHEYQEELN